MMDNRLRRPARSALGRWLTLIVCLSLLTSSSPLVVGAGSLRSGVANARSEAAKGTGAADQQAAAAALDGQPQVPRPEADPAAAPLPRGTVLGTVVNAAGEAPLAGVQVVASGVLDEGPRYRLYLPVVLKNWRSTAAALSLSAAPVASSAVFTTTTAADGTFALAMPAGAYTLTLSLANFGLDRRIATVRANETGRVADVRLHALDPVVAPVGASGGSVTNSLGNTSLQFPAGALPTTQQTRVTYLPNDALPGYFADGSIPMGFAALEPEGLVFPSGKEVLWTVAYTGTLPVGTDTLCYWWDGKTNRWRDPVPGKVVDAGGGKKALQARVTHFSAYGHALPGVEGQAVGGGEYVSAPPNSGQGPCGTLCAGSETNAGTGALAESYGFQSVNAAVFPVGLAIRYATDNDTPSVTARVPFTITTQTPARAEWRLEFQGKTYAGEGYNALAVWDTRNGLGFRVAPGLYEFNATETFYYDSGAQPAMTVKGAVDVRRGDIWPFGFNWISNYDTLLVDHSALVTIIQADGQYLSYLRQPDGSYKPTAGDTGVLVQNPSRTWTRTSPAGGVETWDSLGRLVRLKDPNGNVQTLGYEPLGAPPVEGKWGLTNRLVTITDSSGNVTTLTYGPDGYVSTVTNAIGRAYALAHDATGNLTRITDPLGRAVTYEYDGKHMLTAYMDAEGAATRIGYDTQGRAVRHTDALGGQRTTTYGAGENTITDELGNRTTYTYNNYGAVTRVTAPLVATNYTFDAQRRVVAVDRPYQKYTYDDWGNLTSASGVTSESMTYVPGTNRLATYTNTASYTSRFTYDGQGNLTRVVDPLGNATAMSYNAAGQVTRVTDPLNRSLQLEYNAQGQLVRGTDPLGHVNTAEYDAAGNPARQTDAEGHATAYTYDEGNRATAVTDALGGVTRYDYDRNSRPVRVTDARGNSTSFTYDPLGHITRVTDPLGRSTSVTYDAVGNVLSGTDPNGTKLQFTYDAAGRLTSTQYPGGSATYRYGENNDLAGYIDASAAVTYTYATGLAGRPDSVETGLAGLPRVGSTVSYDYVAPEGGTPAEQGSEAATEPNTSAQEQTAPDLPSLRPLPPPIVADLPSYPAAPAGVATNACGTISTDTTWTLTGSPYVADGCSVYVNRGVTLTIEPGVVVKFGWQWDALYVDGRLSAQGTAGQPIYFTSLDDDSAGGDTNGNGSASQPLPGDWNGVRFRETSAGSILDHVVVRYGGADGATSGIYASIAPFTLTHSTIAQTKGHGLYLETTLPPVVSNNTFVSNTLTAATANLNGAGPSITLSGNTATGNGVNGFRVFGTFNGAGTWTGDPGFPFAVLDADLQVQPGAVLTLSPGAIVKLGNYVWDSVIVHGRLIAQGTAEQPITFTSVRDDSVGGDTNGDGGARPAAPGDWNGVQFRGTSSGSVLDHVVVRYGGSYVNTAGVQANTGAFTLTNSTIAQTRGYGLLMDGGLPPTLSNNAFISNTLAAARGWFNTTGASIEVKGNSARGNGMNGFQVGGVINANSAWAGDPNLPFIIPEGNLVIAPGATLTLTPGTIVKFEHAFVTFQVDGALDARGTAAQPIYLTSLRDDSAGGDTNNDGNASLPAPGDWNLVRFNNPGQQSTLSYTVVRYGGGTGWQLAILDYTSALKLSHSTVAYTRGGGLGIESGSPTVEDSTFLANERGVHAWGNARPVLHRNRFIGNTAYGVRNDTPAAVIDAENNWWGAASGPNDPSDDRASGGFYNPGGMGDKVTDGVAYQPWQMITGLVYGLTVATGANPVQTVRYGYDALNRATSLAASGVAAFSYGYTYDAAGRLTATTPAAGSKGVATTLEYDAGSRLTRLVNRSPNGATTFNSLVYTYDRVGNLTQASDAAGTTTYTYDALNRILGASGLSLNETYTYDAVGNRLSKNGVTYSYNHADQLVSSSDGATYTYDAAGNLRTRTAGGQVTTYSWDAFGRLARIDYPDGTYSAYTYDSQSHRRSKRDRGGAFTYYIYSGDSLVQELDSTGKAIAGYVYDGLDHPLSMTRGGATYHYLYDQLGSVVGLTDGAGGLVAGYRYDPWGNVIATSGSNPALANPFRFTGREWDAESGLYYYRARYYDPQVGRFISRDPLAFAVLGESLYAYAGNNPVVLADPYGHSPATLTPEQQQARQNRHWWQTAWGVGTGILVGAGTFALIVSTGGAATPLVVAGAAFAGTGMGGLAGGFTGMVHEVVTAPTADERCIPGAIWAGLKGGLLGGTIGAVFGPWIGQSVVGGVGSLMNSIATLYRGATMYASTVEISVGSAAELAAIRSAQVAFTGAMSAGFARDFLAPLIAVGIVSGTLELVGLGAWLLGK